MDMSFILTSIPHMCCRHTTSCHNLPFRSPSISSGRVQRIGQPQIHVSATSVARHDTYKTKLDDDADP
jgi:hypothetical protein